jgi:hypothetical protein
LPKPKTKHPKQTKTKKQRSWVLAHMVELLLCRHEALSSKPPISPKKKKKKRYIAK